MVDVNMGMCRYGFEVSPLMNSRVPATRKTVLGLVMMELDRSMACVKMLVENTLNGVHFIAVPSAPQRPIRSKPRW